MKYLFIIASIFWANCSWAFETNGPSHKASETVIEGTLYQVSKLPPAQGNPYPDCYYTAVIDIAHIASGQSIPKKVVLVLPGFFSRQYAPEAKYKVGDKVRVTVVPFASMPDKVRQTQQADEIEDVDLDFFFPEKIALVQEFKSIANPIPFVEVHKKTEEAISFQPVDMKARAARQEQIRHDLKEINKLLAKHGGDWDKWYDSLQNFRKQYKRQFDAKSERWIGDSFFSAGYLANDKIYSPAFIKSLIDLKNFLAARNVDLILVRVPNKGEIVEDLFAPLPNDQTSNPYLLRMYKELLEADVEIVTDIIPRAKAARLKYPLMYYYQDFAEIHPAEGMAWVVADAFAERIGRYDRVKSMPKKVLNIKKEQRPSNDFKWPKGNIAFSPTDYVSFASITDDNGKPLALKQGFDSPVLVLGSSFIAFPSLYKGGSIPHYLASLTGVVPDLLHRSGADQTILRSIAREGDEFLRNRSVCLFPFIPGTAYKALASLPIFDPNKSTKKLLGSYFGPSLREAIEFSPGTVAGTFSYSPDGMLHILPVIKGRGASGSINVRVPEAISQFPHFTLEVEFTSKDITNLTARYSGQTDIAIRSDTQIINEEFFAFITKKSNSLTLDFEGNNYFVRPITIKKISFFGVSQPSSYKK